jgi:hypothetical protein
MKRTAPKEPVLLTREEFNARAFERDKGRCLVCTGPADQVHHILDRKLFSDGGYYLDNAANVCEPCHMRCETTEIPVETVRALAGITRIILPEGWDPSLRFDKWGNVLLDDGRRIKGPLFEDTGVQKVLKLELWMYEDPSGA